MSQARLPENEAAPPLVMLHGFALDSRVWRRQVDALGDEYRLLTIDLPGFGPQARELGEVAPAVEVARAMDAVGATRGHFVASSFGAAVATDFAIRYPARVASLVLVGPMLVGRKTGIDAWPRCVSLAREGDRGTAVEIWLDDPIFEGIRSDEELFEEMRQIVLDYGGGHWTGKIISKWAEIDPLPHLKKIRAPALVISGEMDLPAFMLMAESYARNLPNARREIVQGAGHLVNVEAPDAFNAVLRDFLKSL